MKFSNGCRGGKKNRLLIKTKRKKKERITDLKAKVKKGFEITKCILSYKM